jgi:hypothetical protein
MSRVGNYVFAETSTVNQLVMGLGLVTANLQRPRQGLLREGYVGHLRSSEPGAFRMMAGQRLEDSPQAMDLVQEAVEANYLIWCSTQSHRVRFRVHTSLAPFFGFSYRGAYSDTLVTLEELEQLWEATDDVAHKKAVRSIVTRLTSGESKATELTLSLLDDAELTE